MSKSFESSCEKPYFRHWNEVDNFKERLCDITNFAPFQLLRHYGVNKNHLFWGILTKVVPGLI